MRKCVVEIAHTLARTSTHGVRFISKTNRCNNNTKIHIKHFIHCSCTCALAAATAVALAEKKCTFPVAGGSGNSHPISRFLFLTPWHPSNGIPRNTYDQLNANQWQTCSTYAICVSCSLVQWQKRKRIIGANAK